ncbi:MAG: porin family protein [Proteobacteria bacterium]|nr:porin family protein [Pseudomonadota bacterium]
MEYLKRFLSNLCFCWALLFCTAAKAQWESNWLLGLSAALAEREDKLDLTINHGDEFFSGFSNDQDDNGFVAGILGGYQIRCNDWLFGAELNAQWQDLGQENITAFTDALEHGIELNAQYRQRNIIGLSGRAGYEMFPGFLPYLRLGVLTSRDKLTVVGASLDPASSFDIEGDRQVYRWMGGVGVESPICMLMGLSIRAEYNFQSKGGVVEATGLNFDNVSFAAAHMRPKTHQLLVALVLNFV